MNKVFKVIWNATSQSWVAVSELGKSRTKTKSSKLAPAAVAVAAAMAAGVASAAVEVNQPGLVVNVQGVQDNVNQVIKSGGAEQDTGVYIGGAIVAGKAGADGVGSTELTATGQAGEYWRNSGGQDSVMIGNNLTSLANHSVVIGRNAISASSELEKESPSAYRDDANVVIGYNVEAKTWGSVVVGLNATSNQDNGVAIGRDATSSSKNDIAIGFNATAFSEGSTSGTQSAIAIGTNSNASAISSAAIGLNATASAGLTSAVGVGSNAGAQGDTAIGAAANATGFSSTAVGQRASASGLRATASGADANASGWTSTAIGSRSTASADSASALGANAVASGRFSTSLGTRNNVSGAASTAVGNQNNVSGIGSAAVGTNNTVTAKDAFVFGSNIVDPHEGSVILGANSAATGNKEATDTTFEGTKYTYGASEYAGVIPTSRVGMYVSVGSEGNERQLKNVAAADIKEDSTDAVNGSQLFAVMKRLENVASTGFKLGENDTAGTDGANATNIGLDDKVNFNNGSLTVARVEISGDKNEAKVHYDVVTQALKTDATDGKAAVGTAPAQANGKDAGTAPAVNPNALTTAQNVADAINASGFVVQQNGQGTDVVNPGDKVNFANGTGTTAEAVTAGDTTTVKYNVNTDGTTTKVEGDKVVVAAAEITADKATGKVNPANTAAGTIATAADVVDAINNSGFALKGNGTQAGIVNPGDELNFKNGKGTTAEVAANGDVTFNVAADGTTIKVGEDGKVQAVTSPITQTGTPAAGDQKSTTDTPDALATAGDVVNAVNSARETVTSENKSVVVKPSANALGGTNYDLAVNVDGTTIKQNADGTITALLPKLENGSNTVVNTRTGENGETIYSIDTKNDISDITSIAINGKDGTPGADGTPGKDGTNAVLTIGTGPKGVDGKDGVPGKDGKARIEYVQVDAEGKPVVNENGEPVKEQVATLNDGIKLVGDKGADGKDGENATIAQKLNKEINIKGGAEGELTEKNIGVVADPATNTLTIKLAKDVDLGNNGSVSAGTVNVGGGKDADGNDLPKTALTTVKSPEADVKGKPTGQDVDALSVGGNKITDVANGLINADSKDAINGAQLYDVQNTLNQNISNVAAELDKGLNFDANQGTPVNKKQGETLTVKGELANKAAASAKNTRVDIVNGQLVVKVSENPEFTTVTATDKIAITNGPSMSTNGIDAAGKKITNVAAGTADGDAVNVSQLKEFEAAALEKIDAATKPTVSVDKDASATNSNATQDGVAKDGKDGANGQDGDIKFIAGDNTTIVKEGEKITIGVSKNPEFETVKVGGKGADGQDGVDGKVTVADKAGNPGVTISSADGVGVVGLNGKDGVAADVSVAKGEDIVNADNPNLSEKGANGVDGTNGAGGQGKTRVTYTDPNTGVKEQIATMNDGLVFGGDTGADSPVKLNNKVTVKGGQKDVAKLSNNANVGVVSDGKGNLEVKLAKNIDLGADGSLTTGNTKVDNNGLTIANGPSVTKDGINAGGKAITNLKDGVNASDAATKGQLDRATNALAGSINKLDKRVRGVGANAAAAAALPQVYIPGKSMVAASAGGYGGASALAVGYSRASDNGRTILKLQGTVNSQGHVSGGVGVGFQW